MENVKSRIIPESWKNNIDEIMEKQLFNANRYFAEANPNISYLMQQELYDTPMEFLNKLMSRWNWHNEFYEILLEPVCDSILKEKDVELSPYEIEKLIDVYKASSLVDNATLIMSGVIKKYLEFNCPNISVVSSGNSNTDGYYLLITPPIETFFAQYQIDHLFYIYLLKTDREKSHLFKKELLQKYHANDERIFLSRFEKKFSKYLSMTSSELQEEIKAYIIPEQYKVKHFYFTLEHPERQAIRDIIIYDNLNEKLIASNLIGISGFILRKKILEYLNDSDILKNDGYIYEFNDEIIIDGLERLKLEREKKMIKNVKPYRQHGDTCAICCMMMAMEYYKVMNTSNYFEEKRLYKVYHSKYLPGTPFSALAYHLSKNGIDTEIYHSDPNIFNNNQEVLDSYDFKLAMNEYKEYLDLASESGTKITNGIDINTDLLKEKLMDGKIVILAGEIPGGYHAILLNGYENDMFMVCDPLYKDQRTMSTNQISKFMDTSIGKWFIAIDNKVKEKNELFNKLGEFTCESKKYLDCGDKNDKKYVK